MEGQGIKSPCKCTHHKVLPVLVILFGLTFLLEGLGVITSSFAMIVWPVLVIAGGVMKLVSSTGMCKCC